jgi:hypothetical protein
MTTTLARELGHGIRRLDAGGCAASRSTRFRTVGLDDLRT